MAAIPALVQSGSNNGTVSPATPGSLTTTAGNTLILLVHINGSGTPTASTPAGGWIAVASRNRSGIIVSYIFLLPGASNAGGATNPSSTLTGTVTGWIASMFEISGLTSSGTAVFNGANTATAVPDLYAGIAPTAFYNQLYFYLILRATATWVPTNGWGASIQPQVGVQGMSADFYLQVDQGGGLNPSTAGTLGASVNYVEQVVSINTPNISPVSYDNVGGVGGTIPIGQFYGGLIGG